MQQYQYQYQNQNNLYREDDTELQDSDDEHAAQKQKPLQQKNINQNLTNLQKLNSSNSQRQFQKFNVNDQENQELYSEYSYQNTEKSSRVQGILQGGQSYQEQERKKMIQSNQYQQQLCSRLNQEAIIKKEYHKQLADFVTQEQMKECSFNPSTQTSRVEEKRTLDEFLNDQNKHVKYIEEKKQMIKQYLEQQKDEEFTGQPKINDRPIANRDDFKPVHERLYNLNKKKQENLELKREQAEQMFTKESSFQPTINERSKNIQRNGKVDDILYQDAALRKEKKVQHTSPKKNNKITSNKTDQMVASKLIKQYEKILEEIVGSDSLIDYIKLSEILRSLHFLHSENDFENPVIAMERSLIYDMWHLLQGDRIGGISRRNLCQLCLAIIGCTGLSLFCEQINDVAQKLIKDEEKTIGKQEFDTKLNLIRQQQGNLQIGSFDQYDNWCINEEEAKQLQKYFEMLNMNRLTKEKFKNHIQTEESSFHPQINKKSKKLANQYREKLLEETANLIQNKQINVNVPENGKITHVDLLLFQKKAQQSQHEKKISEGQDIELKGCTFKPEIVSRKKEELQSQRAGIEKSIKLYNMAQPRYQKKDLNKNDLEYEKNCDECTFQPDLQSKQGIKNNKNYVSKDVDKSINRMKKAREQRDLQNQMFERGYQAPININKKLKNQKKESQPQQQKQQEVPELQEEEPKHTEHAASNGSLQAPSTRIPLLFVDVNLGLQNTQRIVVYEGDTAEQLSHQFVQEHGLDENMRQKLEELLESQINSLLTRIEEEKPSNDDEEDHDDY